MIWVILYSSQKGPWYDYSANTTIKTSKQTNKPTKTKPTNQPKIPTKQQKPEALRITKINEQNSTPQVVNKLEVEILMDKWKK